VTLRVVGDDENGSLKSETVNCGLESQERLRWQSLPLRGSVVVKVLCYKLEGRGFNSR
jgi:hypothetical protein